TARTASEIASKLAQALFAPISQQIDPIHMGEVHRYMNIAREYGERLLRKSRNSTIDQLNQLISAYPSHSFVIDENEAKDLFKTVRPFTAKEQALVEVIGQYAYIASDQPIIEYISDALQEQDEQEPKAPAPAQPDAPVPAKAARDAAADGQ